MRDVRTGCKAHNVDNKSGRHAWAIVKASLMFASLMGRCAPGMRYVPLRRGMTREASQACSKER